MTIKKINIYGRKDKNGHLYKYNYENIAQICWAREKNAALANINEVPQKLPWSSTSMYSLHTNTNWIANHYSQKFRPLEDEVERQFKTLGANQAISKLMSIRLQSKNYQDIYLQKLKTVNEKNQQALNSLENKLWGMKLLRDGSATALTICSAMVTVPAGMTALAIGSAMKGIFKFQDTGKVGSASIDFVCEMGVGLIGIGAAKSVMSVGEQVCIVLFAKMPAEGVKCVASGDTLTQSAIASLTEGIGLPAVKGLIGNLLGKIPIPTSFSALSTNPFAELAIGVMENYHDDKSKDFAKSTVSANNSNKNNINIDALKTSHLNNSTAQSDEQFIKKYCITRI